MTCNLYIWLKACFTDCLAVLDFAHLKLNIIRAPDSVGCRKVEKGYL